RPWAALRCASPLNLHRKFATVLALPCPMRWGTLPLFLWQLGRSGDAAPAVASGADPFRGRRPAPGLRTCAQRAQSPPSAAPEQKADRVAAVARGWRLGRGAA